MFLSALGVAFTVTIIAVVLVQYAFALFCLLKLAYLDISRRDYALWNVFILLAFFIGGAVFLVYYYKHPDKWLNKYGKSSAAADDTEGDSADESETSDADETTDVEIHQRDDDATPSDSTTE